MKKTVFLSFPRSGRSYLRRLLREYYGGPGAGGDVANEPRSITFEHDFLLTRVQVPEEQYVVITRDPVRAIHSYEKMDDDRLLTYADKLAHWAAFSHKWVFPKELCSPRLIIPYEDLIGGTQRIMHILIFFLGEIPDASKIDRVIRDNPPRFRPWHS
jgi:hypothetical protein